MRGIAGKAKFNLNKEDSVFSDFLVKNEAEFTGVTDIYYTNEPEDLAVFAMGEANSLQFFVVIGGCAMPIIGATNRNPKMLYVIGMKPCKWDECTNVFCTFAHKYPKSERDCKRAIQKVCDSRAPRLIDSFVDGFRGSMSELEDLCEDTVELMKRFTKKPMTPRSVVKPSPQRVVVQSSPAAPWGSPKSPVSVEEVFKTNAQQRKSTREALVEKARKAREELEKTQKALEEAERIEREEAEKQKRVQAMLNGELTPEDMREAGKILSDIIAITDKKNDSNANDIIEEIIRYVGEARGKLDNPTPVE
jgi:hypothetical protein